MRKYKKVLGFALAITLLPVFTTTVQAEGIDPIVRSMPGMTMEIHPGSSSSDNSAKIVDASPLPAAAMSQSVSDTSDKVIYLTFDDGPVEGTENVLNVLSEEGVDATMFCIGRHAQKRPSLFRRELEMRNLMIANHTYSHANGHYARFYSNLWGVMSDVEHAQLILGGRKYLRLAGRNVWRLPEVRRNDLALSPHRRQVEIPKYEQLAKEGFFIYGWDVEWRFNHHDDHPIDTPERLASRIESIWHHHRTAQQGKVVLLAHDFMFRDAASTGELRRFLRIMKRRGWSFQKIARYSAARPRSLHVVKYYGKEENALLASAEPAKTKRVSNAYLPANTAATAHRRTSDTLSLQASLNNAIRSYEASKVDQLVREGARINQRDEYGRLALNTAIRSNSLLLVKKLLSLGADPRATDARGFNALSAARIFRRADIKKYLIEYSLSHGARHLAALNDIQVKKAIDPLTVLK